ncbi:MAG TPA: site-2 protease family protein, partial [Acidimicrobiales bacterium]|nr:site-2 protease family protein [Acidimicrobiales bacterium]
AQWPLTDLVLFLLGEVNVIIAVFNLIPIPPLDGSAVLERLLPASALPSYYRLRSISMLLVLFLVFAAPGVLNTIFNHALQYWGDIVL